MHIRRQYKPDFRGDLSLERIEQIVVWIKLIKFMLMSTNTTTMRQLKTCIYNDFTLVNVIIDSCYEYFIIFLPQSNNNNKNNLKHIVKKPHTLPQKSPKVYIFTATAFLRGGSDQILNEENFETSWSQSCKPMQNDRRRRLIIENIGGGLL
ncbi:hypothetical protein FF38_05221 [Lucilia cuprina]|uniref:Uncharacterized protein n=1 Tax=Lucilia cuprina TaxID=7375 RepID=A0A0L0CE28_LUCCU|nr:hypothetical protein FF38_05221 [Lucilia cuprina]